MDIKREINSTTVIVGDFKTHLKSMDRSSIQKINKKTVALNDILDQMVLIVILRVLHPKAAEYTLFSSALGICSMIDHVLWHKTSLNES